jgi:hypothetical protein
MQQADQLFKNTYGIFSVHNFAVGVPEIPEARTIL